MKLTDEVLSRVLGVAAGEAPHLTFWFLRARLYYAEVDAPGSIGLFDSVRPTPDALLRALERAGLA